MNTVQPSPQHERAWEGLGGPVRVGRPSMDDLDPTMEACCRRDEESFRRGNALKQTLQRHDVVAEKERRRRNLVTAFSFEGCRCCYDPNSDGGEYRALAELRERRRLEKSAEEKGEEETSREDGAEKENEAFNDLPKSSKDVDDSDGSDSEFDYLLDEDLPGQNEELAALEELRRAELEFAMLQREAALQHGYGVHRQMHPSRILKAAGLVPGTRDPPTAVVIHLVDPDSTASASLDLYLEELAETSARGTKFVRSGGRATLLMDADLSSKVLPRLGYERDLPALIAVKDGVAVNVCPRLQGLVDCDRAGEDGLVRPDAVYQWLARSGVLQENVPPHYTLCRIRPEEEALMDYLLTMKPQPEEEERFDCGVAECNKTFPHEHVGIQNEQQQGLVVAEEEVVQGPDAEPAR